MDRVPTINSMRRGNHMAEDRARINLDIEKVTVRIRKLENIIQGTPDGHLRSLMELNRFLNFWMSRLNFLKAESSLLEQLHHLRVNEELGNYNFHLQGRKDVQSLCN